MIPHFSVQEGESCLRCCCFRQCAGHHALRAGGLRWWVMQDRDALSKNNRSTVRSCGKTHELIRILQLYAEVQVLPAPCAKFIRGIGRIQYYPLLEVLVFVYSNFESVDTVTTLVNVQTYVLRKRCLVFLVCIHMCIYMHTYIGNRLFSTMATQEGVVRNRSVIITPFYESTLTHYCRQPPPTL